MSDANKISSEELREIAAEIADSFPPPRAGTELHLLDVNPHRAHAYWHIDPADMSAARARAGTSPLVIRMHDVTGVNFDGQNPHDTNDTVVSGETGQTDLHVRKSGRTYLAELGLRLTDGQLERLATSDTIELPRAPVIHAMQHHTSPANIGDLARMQMAGLAAITGTSPEPIPASTPESLSLMTAAAPDWPDAAELTALIPNRSDKVDTLYQKTDGTTLAITAAQEKMLIEIRNVPDVIEQTSSTPTAPLDAHGPAAFPTFLTSQLDAPIRIEDFLSYSSHNLGAVSEDIAVFVEFAVHGQVPAGRSVTLFGSPVPVDGEGAFLLRRELLQPGALLPGLFQQSRAIED